jgi:tetratricopeptide (TPR) repeat protein
VIAAALCVLLILILLLTPQPTHAQNLADPGQMMPFASANAAYRVGLYYFNQGDYERAVSELATAINGIPAEVFPISVDYAVFYWSLGDAQLMNMQYDDALASYEHFLELAGEAASDAALQYVGILRAAIGINATVNVTFVAG